MPPPPRVGQCEGCGATARVERLRTAEGEPLQLCRGCSAGDALYRLHELLSGPDGALAVALIDHQAVPLSALYLEEEEPCPPQPQPLAS